MLQLAIEKTYKRVETSFQLHAAFKLKEDRPNTVFFGPSGAGKSLTMNCIAGLLNADCGYITFKDQVFFNSEMGIKLPARKRRIGYMFQDYALFPHLTVLQNVAYARSGLLGRFLSKKERVRAQELIETLGLEDLGARKPQELSGGQKQRVALARALNSAPQLLLLDEPFNALDPLLREQLRKELKIYLGAYGLPSIIISHDPEDVETFCDQLVLFENGRCKLVENYQKLRNSYANCASCLRALQKDFQAELREKEIMRHIKIVRNKRI